LHKTLTVDAALARPTELSTVGCREPRGWREENRRAVVRHPSETFRADFF